MPDDLTEAQLTELRELLVELRDELRELMAAGAEDRQPVDLDLPIGRLTRIDAIQQQKMAEANRRTLERRLRQTDAAFDAFERGEYGDCHRCGEPIGYTRLKARPEAALCLDCQGLLESS